MVGSPSWNLANRWDDYGAIHDESLEDLYMIGPASIR
jgi:hypothetical protein